MNNEMKDSFLALRDFHEYLSRYEEFIGISSGQETFRKEIELMESDDGHTHRQKEQLVQKKKREILKRLHGEIEVLCDEVTRDGAYSIPDVQESGDIHIVYLYPDGKRGDVNHVIVLEKASSIEVEGEIYNALFPASAYKEIDLLLFPVRNLFVHYDFSRVTKDAATMYLMRYNRILQLEYRMWKINCLSEEYRSLRSVEDKRLRQILQKHHKTVESARNEIYEKLIEDNNTHAKWISEQKAYAIVKRRYPDAKFQYQADWLKGQKLDIFIPSRNAGIEYQGKQHTEAVEFFGGESGLRDNMERDKRKRFRCKANGVKLLYWSYYQPLTEEFFQKNIVPMIE